MPCRTFAVALIALAAARAQAASVKPTFLGASTSFVQQLQFKQVLRVCNAYPYAASGMDVFLGSEQLTKKPLAYKTCEDYAPAIQSGDRVDFKAGSDSAGTFTISGLPVGDATLLLIIYRHDAMTTTAAFASHAFPRSESTQVAIIDTFKGKKQTEVRIEDVKPTSGSKTQTHRSELLRYNSVVAITPGLYNVQLVGDSNASATSTAEFVAAPRQSYAVVRCGVESADGKAYPQEMMIFPHSDKAALGAAGPLRSRSLWLVAAAVVASLGALSF